MAGFRYPVSGKVAPAGPLVLDEGHWAAEALGHAWVFNQQTRVVDLATGTKGTFATTPTAANRVNTRWGPGYQLGAQGSGDYIKTLVSSDDCRQGNVAIIMGFSNYTAPTYVALATREPAGTYTYGSTAPGWTVEADPTAIYWDNGNAGGEQTRATGPGGGTGYSAFLAARDSLNILTVTDNGTTAGTNIYINNGLMAQFAGSGTLQYGTAAASTDSVQFGNTWGAISADYFRCCLHFAYIFKRALSRMEIASLSDNPYQFWVPESIQVRLFAPAPTGASAPLTGNAGITILGVLGKALQNALAATSTVGLIGSMAAGTAVTPTGTAATGAAGVLSLGSLALTGTSGTADQGTLSTVSSPTISSAVASGAAGTLLATSTLGLGSVAGTGTAGTASPQIAASLIPAVGTGVVGPMQAQGSEAAYLLGASGSSSLGAIGVLSSSGATLPGAQGVGFAGNAIPGLMPLLFGNGGTGRLGVLALSGTIIAPGSAYPQGVEAAAVLGDLDGVPAVSASISGTTARGGIGGPVVTLPGVWIKKTMETGSWIRSL